MHSCINVYEYSKLKHLWMDDGELIKYKFPVVVYSKYDIRWEGEIHPYVSERLIELGYDPPYIDYKTWYWKLENDMREKRRNRNE